MTAVRLARANPQNCGDITLTRKPASAARLSGCRHLPRPAASLAKALRDARGPPLFSTGTTLFPSHAELFRRILIAVDDLPATSAKLDTTSEVVASSGNDRFGKRASQIAAKFAAPGPS